MDVRVNRHYKLDFQEKDIQYMAFYFEQLEKRIQTFQNISSIHVL